MKKDKQDLGIGVLAIRSTLVNWSTRFETLNRRCVTLKIEFVSIPYVVFMVFTPTSRHADNLEQKGTVANSNDVPAGPTVSSKPSRLKANNILEISWATLAVLLVYQ